MSHITARLSPQPFVLFSLLMLVLVAWAKGGVIQWDDSGMFLVDASRNPLFATDLGEMSHPLFHLVSVAAYRLGGVTAVSWLNVALFPLVGYLVRQVARQLGADAGLSAAAMAAAMGIHSVLWVSTRVEVYSLHLVLVLACWWVYLGMERSSPGIARLLGLGCLAGMALSVHQLTLIVLAPMALALLWQWRLRSIWAMAGFVLGLFACLPAYLSLHAQDIPFLDIVRGFITGGAKEGEAPKWEHLFFNLDQLLVKWHLAAAVLVSICGMGLVGLVRWPTLGAARLVWMAALMNLLFAATYDVPDRFSFFLPGSVLFAVLGVIAVGPWVSRAWAARLLLAMVVAPVLMCHALVQWVPDTLMTLPRVKSPAPFYNPVTHFFSPLWPDRSAEKFVTAYEELVPPGAVVYGNFHSLHALLSAQTAGRFVGRDVRPCEGSDLLWPPQHPAYLAQTLDCQALASYPMEVLSVGYKLTAAAPAQP